MITSTSYTKWSEGEPNDEGGIENYVMYYAHYPNVEDCLLVEMDVYGLSFGQLQSFRRKK